MLRRVEGEYRPSRCEYGVGGYRVAGEEDPAVRPPEGEVTWRMAGRMEYLDGADRVPVPERGVHGAGRMFAASQRGAELQVVDAPVGAQGSHRHRRDGLGCPLARDDVGLPGMGVDGRAAQGLQGGKPSEVGTVGVCQHDVLQVFYAPADGFDPFDHPPGVGVEERVDQRQLGAVVEQEGVYVASLALVHAIDSWCYFHA